MQKRKNKISAAEREAGINEVVRDWLLRTEPQEESMIGSFSKTVTFKELAQRMREGEEFYEILDCTESVQREYCFKRLSELYSTTYDYWYLMWLHRATPDSEQITIPPSNGRIKLITRIID